MSQCWFCLSRSEQLTIEALTFSISGTATHNLRRFFLSCFLSVFLYVLLPFPSFISFFPLSPICFFSRNFKSIFSYFLVSPFVPSFIFRFLPVVLALSLFPALLPFFPFAPFIPYILFLLSSPPSLSSLPLFCYWSWPPYCRWSTVGLWCIAAARGIEPLAL